MTTEDRSARVIAAIDAANAKDPNQTVTPEGAAPAELVYGERMSAMLATIAPNASEALRIAVRGQHIERWLQPRSEYPEGRAGYFAWRNAAKRYHAGRLGGLMRAYGYSDGEIGCVAALVRKENLRTDHETQTLEDVACLVFLKYYAPGFVEKHPDADVVDILAKTLRKMSPRAMEEARRLQLAETVANALAQALSTPSNAGSAGP